MSAGPGSYTSVASAKVRASSTSTPRYLTVVSIFECPSRICTGAAADRQFVAVFLLHCTIVVFASGERKRGPIELVGGAETLRRLSYIRTNVEQARLRSREMLVLVGSIMLGLAALLTSLSALICSVRRRPY